MLKKISCLAHRFIRDKNGTIVLWQFPNAPLALWFVFMGFALTFTRLKIPFNNLSSVFLFVWAYLEISQGVTYSRRFLGLIVAIGIMISYFR